MNQYNIVNDSNLNRNQGRPHAPGQRKLVILYENELPAHYSGLNLPTELAERRNHTIKAMYLQSFSVVAGFAFYFVRKVEMYFYFTC
jgi:hypothetical protein